MPVVCEVGEGETYREQLHGKPVYVSYWSAVENIEVLLGKALCASIWLCPGRKIVQQLPRDRQYKTSSSQKIRSDLPIIMRTLLGSVSLISDLNRSELQNTQQNNLIQISDRFNLIVSVLFFGFLIFAFMASTDIGPLQNLSRS